MRKGVLSFGLALVVFSALSWSGPGRVDIVDGQTRYEVARSLVARGDSVIREPNVWFSVFPGRLGQLYSYYRFPQSVLGIPAILVADALGPKSEARRHFFFSLTGAVACATLAVLYLVWFRRTGLSERQSVSWALLGIFATPAWFYATSTFDDILGTAAIVGALVMARTGRQALAELKAGPPAGPSPGRALAAGLLVGLAFNCKQPLGIFVLPVAVAAARAAGTRSRQAWHAALVGAGLAAGIAVYLAYDLYKFPPGTKEAHAALLLQYVPVWPGNTAIALLVLALSPAAGVLWYFPALLLTLRGLATEQRALLWSFVLAAGIFVVFIASMTIFKGDPSWGPRYLTPVFGLLWLWAPRGAACLPRTAVVPIVAASVAVQFLSVTVDQHRLYVERRLPSAFGAIAPVLYFDWRNAHLINRPREILEIWRARHDPGTEFSPAPTPTFTLPILDEFNGGPDTVRRYTVLNTFRPWWASQIYLPEHERPVRISTAVAVLVAIFTAGVAMLIVALRKNRHQSGVGTVTAP